MQDNLSLIKSKNNQDVDQAIRNVFDQVSVKVDQIAGKASEVKTQQPTEDVGVELLLIIILIILILIFAPRDGGGYNGLTTSGVWIGNSPRRRSSSPDDWLGGGGFGGGGSFGGGSFGGGGSSV